MKFQKEKHAERNREIKWAKSPVPLVSLVYFWREKNEL